MQYNFFSAFIILILVTDPFGNIPIFINNLKNVEQKRKLYIILREVLIAFCVLLFFMIYGKNFLHLLQLSELAMKMAGSMVMFLISINMIFPNENVIEKNNLEEPFIVPLAIPLLAGPSSIATVMLLSSQAPNSMLTWVGALVLSMICCFIVLMMAEYIQKVLGSKVVAAFERLMGLILVSMSVEMFLSSIRTFIHSL